MGYDFIFQPLSLQRVLQTVVKGHPFWEEIADLDYREEAAHMIDRLEKVPEENMHIFSFTLKNSELDYLFHALKEKISCPIREKLLAVLKHRMKKRFFTLNWILLQSYYDNSNLLASMDMLCSYMQEKHPADYGQSLLKLLREEDGGDYLQKGYPILTREGGIIADFAQKYHLMGNSRYVKELSYLFLSKCESAGYDVNQILFCQMIHEDPLEKLLPVIQNYLEKLDVLDFWDTVNTRLIDRFGGPDEGSLLWRGLSQTAGEKLIKWIYIKKMEVYFGENHERFTFWKGYFAWINNVSIGMDEECIFMDMNRFVIMERGKTGEDTYLLLKERFNELAARYKECKDPEERRAVLEDIEGVVTVKDAFLYNLRSDVYKISSEGVGILYTKEMMKRIQERGQHW